MLAFPPNGGFVKAPSYIYLIHWYTDIWYDKIKGMDNRKRIGKMILLFEAFPPNGGVFFVIASRNNGFAAIFMLNGIK